MNPVRKIYCRTFQTGLKAALPFLPYRKPKIVGSVKALPEIIQEKKCTKVLLITDAGIRKLGLTRRLEKALDAAGIPCFIYDKTVANPTTDNVAEAMEPFYRMLMTETGEASEETVVEKGDTEHDRTGN